VVERKNVQRWEAAVAQAEEKLRRIKHWSTALEREFMLFKAGMQSMSNIVAADLPNATARIERMTRSLEEYIRLAAPSGAPTTAGSVGDEQRSEQSSSAPSAGDGAKGESS